MPEPVSILAVTRDPEEWKVLESIAGKENWLLFWAHDADLAYELIRRHRIQIVIYDRNVNGEDWRTIVAHFAKIYPPVCTLLASEVADEYLWREVVHNKGFEVLTKPFDPEKVIRTVRYASWVLPSLTNNSFTHRVKN
jgi:DNA-binding NtrC family response regulator